MPALVIGSALRLERARNDGGCASKAANHFSQHVIVFDIDRIRGDLGRCVAVADVPRYFEQAQRVFRTNFEQRLGCRFHQNEAAIFEFQRIAIIQDGRLFKIKQEFEALFAGQCNPAAMPTFMIKTD